jgi:hypothetical protein
MIVEQVIGFKKWSPNLLPHTSVLYSTLDRVGFVDKDNKLWSNDTNERNPIIRNHTKKSSQWSHVGMCQSTLWILTYLQWDWHQKSKRKQIGWGTTTTHVYNAWYPIKALQKHLQFAASRWWKWWSWSKQAITTEFIDDTCCIYAITWFWLNLIFERFK